MTRDELLPHFDSYPLPRPVAWELDAATGSLLCLEETALLLPGGPSPGNPPRPVRLRFLSFEDRGTPLVARTEPPGLCDSSDIDWTEPYPKLKLHVLTISRWPSDANRIIRWEVGWPDRKPGSRSASNPLAPNGCTGSVSVSGTIEIAPPAYGLSGCLTWSHDPWIDFPIPVAHPLGESHKGGRAAPTGVSVSSGGETPIACLPIHGMLRLQNDGPYQLRFRLDYSSGIRVWQEHVVLAAGASVRLAIQRRRTLAASQVQACQVIEVNGTVEPILQGSRAPAVRLHIARTAEAGPAHTYCLPPDTTVLWKLKSWMKPGLWTLSTHVVGTGTAEVFIGPEAEPLRRVRALVPPYDPSMVANGGGEIQSADTARRADIVVMAQPAVLLEWFPGAMDQISGQLVVEHAGSNRGFVVPFSFTASLDGLMSIDRSFEIEAEAGQPFLVPLDVMFSGGKHGRITAHWKWLGRVDAEGATDAGPSGAQTPGDDWYTPASPPYSVDCGFVTSPPAARNSVVIKGVRLPPVATARNQERTRRVHLQVRPHKPDGSERGAWLGLIVLRTKEGETLDEIRVRYTLRPFAPQAALAAYRGPTTKGTIRFRLTVLNPNPFRSLDLNAVDLAGGLKLLGFPLSPVVAQLDRRPSPVDRIAPLKTRVYEGSLRARSALPRRLLARYAGWVDVNVQLHASYGGPANADGTSWPSNHRIKIDGAVR